MLKKTVGGIVSAFSTDVAILSWDFQNYHSHNSRVIIDPESRQIKSVCVHRPSNVGVSEEQDTISISFNQNLYKRLFDATSCQPPFPVYAWHMGVVVNSNQRGYSRGFFKLERRNDLSMFVLHRIPSGLSNLMKDEEVKSPEVENHRDATEDAIRDAVNAENAEDFLNCYRFNPKASKRGQILQAAASAATHPPRQTAEGHPPRQTDEGHPPRQTDEGHPPRQTAEGHPPRPPSPVMSTPVASTRVVSTPVASTRVVSTRTYSTAIPVAPAPSKRLRTSNDPSRFGLKTEYRGVTYRSRKEARFAFALTEMGIPYIYEPMTFSRPSGGKYMPDFFLPRQQLWVELKPQRPHVEEELKCEEMSSVGFRVALIYGESIESPPFRREADAKRESGSRDYKHRDGLRGMAWIDGEKLAGDTVFVKGANPRGSPLELLGQTSEPHLDQVSSTRDMRWDNSDVISALKLAGAEKFQ
jgi:hypothetical protein